MSDWDTIFNARGALLALFGALGGAVRSAALKTTWREGLRVVFIGSATSFGFGVLSQHLLKWAFHIEMPEEVSASLGGLCATAFIVGLVAVTIIERIAEGRRASEVDHA